MRVLPSQYLFAKERYTGKTLIQRGEVFEFPLGEDGEVTIEVKCRYPDEKQIDYRRIIDPNQTEVIIPKNQAKTVQLGNFVTVLAEDETNPEVYEVVYYFVRGVEHEIRIIDPNVSRIGNEVAESGCRLGEALLGKRPNKKTWIEYGNGRGEIIRVKLLKIDPPRQFSINSIE